MNEYAQERKTKAPWYIFEPSSYFKLGWNTVILICVLYIATLSPYIQAFEDDVVKTAATKFFDGFDIFVDCVFICDICLNFFSAYERPNGATEYRLKKIALNYITGFFLIDLVATIPFNWLRSGGDEADGPDTNNFLRLIRL